MKKVPIKDATEAQLRAFGESHLGLQFEPTEQLAAIRSKVEAVWTKPEIQLADEKAAPKVAAGTAAKPKRPETQDGQPVLVARTKKHETEPLVRVMIAKTEGAGGADDVPLGCNGEIMTVPRGKIIDIPRRYFESLKNAVKHVYDTTEDGKSLNPVPRQVPEFSYQTYTPSA
jgi:hypothetical protein